jgi:hypothetical protein
MSFPMAFKLDKTRRNKNHIALGRTVRKLDEGFGCQMDVG